MDCRKRDFSRAKKPNSFRVSVQLFQIHSKKALGNDVFARENENDDAVDVTRNAHGIFADHRLSALMHGKSLTLVQYVGVWTPFTAK